MKAKDVRDNVRAWVASVLGIEVIHAFPNADAPREPYAVVQRVMSAPVHANPAGEDFTEGAGGTILQAPLIETYWRFMIDVFGSDPEDYLQRLKSAADVPTTLWALRPLVLFETTRITSENEIRDQSFKGRANMTIEVRGMVRDGFVIDTVEQQTPEFSPVD